MSAARAAAVAFALAGCAPATAARAVGPNGAPTAKHAPHVQVVHALSTPERKKVFDAFVARNPGPWLWADARQVDAFTGHLVLARRGDAAGAPHDDLDGGALQTKAVDFLDRNADLLGFRHKDLVALELRRESAGVVLARASIPLRGYLAFPRLASVISIALSFDARGEIVEVVNESTLHPPLVLGLDPTLRPDDPRVVANVVGRRVFALDEPPTRRIELGTVAPDDVRDVRPDIVWRDGPLGAYRIYRFAYVVDVVRSAPGAPQLFFFSWLVDPDTGEVVEDPKVPVAGAAEEEP